MPVLRPKDADVLLAERLIRERFYFWGPDLHVKSYLSKILLITVIEGSAGCQSFFHLMTIPAIFKEFGISSCKEERF